DCARLCRGPWHAGCCTEQSCTGSSSYGEARRASSRPSRTTSIAGPRGPALSGIAGSESAASASAPSSWSAGATSAGPRRTAGGPPAAAAGAGRAGPPGPPGPRRRPKPADLSAPIEPPGKGGLAAGIASRSGVGSFRDLEPAVGPQPHHAELVEPLV